MSVTLDKRYDWLNKEPGPKIMLEAIQEYGTLETPGDANNPIIISWARELGEKIQNIYKADSIPWCGLFMGICALRAGVAVPENPLWALSWSAWGTPVTKPMLGDVLVFTRNGGGHVGLYIGEDTLAYHVLGGNQSDSVSISRIAKERLYCARRTPWKYGQPSNVREVIFKPNGTISKNEA